MRNTYPDSWSDPVIGHIATAAGILTREVTAADLDYVWYKCPEISNTDHTFCMKISGWKNWLTKLSREKKNPVVK